MTFEQHAEVLLGLSQSGLSVLATGDVVAERMEPDAIGVSSAPEGELYRKRATVAMLTDELEAPPEQRFLARRGEFSQTLIVEVRVAIRLREDDVLAATAELLQSGSNQRALRTASSNR